MEPKSEEPLPPFFKKNIVWIKETKNQRIKGPHTYYVY